MRDLVRLAMAVLSRRTKIALILAAVGLVLIAATLVAYAIWSRLLTTYPTSMVAPFTLLVPVIGVAAAALLLDERFTALRAGGMVLMLCGVAVAIITPRTWNVERRTEREHEPRTVNREA